MVRSGQRGCQKLKFLSFERGTGKVKKGKLRGIIVN